MKKNSVISFVLTMLLIALNVIPAFSVENMNFSAGYTEYKNDLNKIHFYFTEPIDENDNISFRTIFESEEKEYQYIDSERQGTVLCLFIFSSLFCYKKDREPSPVFFLFLFPLTPTAKPIDTL